MRQIRRSVFETASSSVHSLTIVAGDLVKSDYKDKSFEIFPGEFGWGYDKFTDSHTKASYCYTWLQYVHENRERFQEMLVKAIKDHTGAFEVVFSKSTDSYWPEGYIDDQSTDLCTEVFESEDNIKNFIFNPQSTLIIDNDNK